MPHHQVSWLPGLDSPLIHFLLSPRDYLERESKAEAFKIGEEELDDALKAAEEVGNKLKTTAEDVKKAVEEKSGVGLALLPQLWMVLIPKFLV